MDGQPTSTPWQAVNLLPRAISEHRLDTPRGSKDVKRFGEAVIVDQAGVDGEYAHEQDQVTPIEEGVPDLAQGNRKGELSVESKEMQEMGCCQHQ